jgi:hypothetical protein
LSVIHAGYDPRKQVRDRESRTGSRRKIEQGCAAIKLHGGDNWHLIPSGNSGGPRSYILRQGNVVTLSTSPAIQSLIEDFSRVRNETRPQLQRKPLDKGVQDPNIGSRARGHRKSIDKDMARILQCLLCNINGQRGYGHFHPSRKQISPQDPIRTHRNCIKIDHKLAHSANFLPGFL